MGPIILTSPLQGWATSLDDVPDAAFSDRLLGDGIAIDPLGDTLCAPCDGEVLTLHDSHHAVTLRGDGGVEILLHLGIDTVALSGKGFTPLVTVGMQVTRGQPLIQFDLDALAMAAPSLMTPVIITNSESFHIQRRVIGKAVGIGEGILYLDSVKTAAPFPPQADGKRIGAAVRVPMLHGIHARPAARIGETARAFLAESWIIKDGSEASTRSPIGLMRLGVHLDDEVTIEAAGEDAEAALAALRTLLESGMGESSSSESEKPLTPSHTPIAAPAPTNLSDGALAGTLAAPGYCIGTAHWFRLADIEVPRDGKGAGLETQRLDSALATLAEHLQDQGEANAQGSIRRAHLALLQDPTLRDDALAQINAGRSAEHGWRMTCRIMADAMRTSGDLRLAERADDLNDLERRVLHILTGMEEEALAFPPGTILLAEELLPSHIMALDSNVVGIVLERGGPTSHVAILAASMGLPMLVAIGKTLSDTAEGMNLILDADGGFLHVSPSVETLAEAKAEMEKRIAARSDALASASIICISRDGVRIEAFANLGSLEDATLAMANGAEGSGLLRTEFLFLERDSAPTAKEQAALYQAIAQELQGRPLIVRLLDIGGDKPAPYLPIVAEENPALGLRGIRVGLTMPELLDQQLRAILSVTPHGQCRIMVPMVANAAELLAVRARVEALRVEMDISAPVEVGIMVETPAAAVTAATLARHADFLSIGTNDLTQYALAMDRGNPAVASGIDGLHPAILRLIALTAQGARQHERWVGVCGGLASDRLAIPLLLGLGITELSAAPRFVPDLKALVRRLSLSDCRAHAERALGLESAADVRALARRFDEELPQ